jgi:hypothetical protein
MAGSTPVLRRKYCGQREANAVLPYLFGIAKSGWPHFTVDPLTIGDESRWPQGLAPVHPLRKTSTGIH